MNAQARLGAFVLIAVITLGVVSSRLGGYVWFGEENHTVETIFDDMLGLEVQSSVHMAGVKIGVVQAITLRDNRAVVTIALNPDVRLPASTRAMIVSRGMVGEKTLYLYARPGDTEWLPDGATIPSDPTMDISKFIASMSGVVDDIKNISASLRATFGTKEGQASLSALIDNANKAVLRIDTVLQENQADVRNTIHNLSETSNAIQKDLPSTLADLRQAMHDIRQFVSKHQKDLDRFAKALPEATKAGQAFFEKGEQAMQRVDDVVMDNRENLYRTLFELRKMSENLEALSDDLRRNPWKMTSKQPEVPPSPRAKQEKMEEMLLSTGQMGVAPARK